MKVYFREVYIGFMPDNVFSAFYYCCREWGLQLEVDWEEGKVVLLPGLFGRGVTVIKEEQPSIRMEAFESQILYALKENLESSGIQMSETTDYRNSQEGDLLFSLQIIEDPLLEQSTLELYYPEKDESVKWLELVKEECQKAGIKIVMHEQDSPNEYPIIIMNMRFSEVNEGLSWEKDGKSLVHILTIGLLCKLQSSLRLSPLSVLPLEELFYSFIKGASDTMKPTNTAITTSMMKESSVEAPMELLSDAEAMFDYHILLGDSMKSPQIFGSLLIKNIGEVPLKNPCVCFRVTPAGSVHLTGQILPPNTAKIRGIQTVEGTKGWMFMNENWLEEADEKGEYWVCPIQEMQIEPGETLTLSNLKMKLIDSKSMRVEAFIFFRENELELAASNKISIMIKGT